MLVLILVALVALLAGALYLYLSRRYSTWKRKGVPGPPAAAFAMTIPKVLRLRESMGDVADRVYKEYNDNPLAGTYVFGNPVLHVHDPEIIKHILIKEFQDFSGRAGPTPNASNPLGGHLFFLGGSAWKNLRVKLAPAFTSGKIKYMFETIRKNSEQLADYLDERIAANGGKHFEDARPLMMRLFVDTTSSVAFGIDSNVVKDINSEFYVAARKAVEPSWSNAWRFLFLLFGSEFMRPLGVRSVPVFVEKFFRGLVHDTVQYREQNGVERADLMHLLIQLKNKGFVAPDKDAKDTGKTEKVDQQGAGDKDQKKFTDDDIAAQMFLFFIAGFESSSSTTSFTLFEMAKNPQILEQALREVDQVMADFDGKITYEAIMSMPYLDKCINETLRKYPPLAIVTREAMVTRKVPLTDVVVEKGTRLIIPIRALHYDPQYWPEPQRYDPERFSDEQKATRPSMVHIPFGEGPRICIAARLGLVQIKTALLTLLSKYTVTIDPSSPQEVSINPRSFATTPNITLDVIFSPRKAFADVQKRKHSVGVN